METLQISNFSISSDFFDQVSLWPRLTYLNLSKTVNFNSSSLKINNNNNIKEVKNGFNFLTQAPQLKTLILDGHVYSSEICEVICKLPYIFISFILVHFFFKLQFFSNLQEWSMQLKSCYYSSSPHPENIEALPANLQCLKLTNQVLSFTLCGFIGTFFNYQFLILQ